LWPRLTLGDHIAVVAEILDIGGAGIQRLTRSAWRTDADTGVEAAAGEDVDRRQVFGQSQRILPAQGIAAVPSSMRLVR
jgi:hypothetical protein